MPSCCIGIPTQWEIAHQILKTYSQLLILWSMNIDLDHPDEEESEALIALLEELDTIDECSAEAGLNRYSINDNNGGRIELITLQERQLPLLLRLIQLLSPFKAP